MSDVSRLVAGTLEESKRPGPPPFYQILVADNLVEEIKSVGGVKDIQVYEIHATHVFEDIALFFRTMKQNPIYVDALKVLTEEEEQQFDRDAFKNICDFAGGEDEPLVLRGCANLVIVTKE
eukprot:TRINITY_DN1291_c0_g1_i2.p2 TRINITY_DN1291_c0_g1~~TRINITY_DN1291_c0_g1_i2.p2  ORF type:complete len:121 (-),score=42.99 TRINITY_DN1291_c0_g1_i2:21-383(-)